MLAPHSASGVQVPRNISLLRDEALPGTELCTLVGNRTSVYFFQDEKTSLSEQDKVIAFCDAMRRAKVSNLINVRLLYAMEYAFLSYNVWKEIMEEFHRVYCFNGWRSCFAFDENGFPVENNNPFDVLCYSDIWQYAREEDYSFAELSYVCRIVKFIKKNRGGRCNAKLEIDGKCQKKDGSCGKGHSTIVFECRRTVKNSKYCHQHKSFDIHNLSECTRNRIETFEFQANIQMEKFISYLNSKRNAEIVKLAKLIDVSDIDSLIASYLC